MNKGRLILIAALALISLAAPAQIKLHRYTTATDTFYWKRYIRIPQPKRLKLSSIALSVNSKVIDRFISQNLSEFPLYANDSLRLCQGISLKRSLYPVDLDGNSLPDILFSGCGDGGTNVVRLYLNRGDTFALVFEDYQYLSEFRKENGRLSRIVTGDIGANKDYLFFTREYGVHWDQGEPVIVAGRQHVDYRNTEEPSRYYPIPVQFTSLADTLMLRASAARLDEPYLPDMDTFGNIIAKYRTKVRGEVLAAKSTGKGNDWYYVEVYPDARPSASILYGLDRMPGFVRGWVSGHAILRDVK